MESNEKPSFWVKLSTFIVDKRNFFFLLFALSCIFSVFSSAWVKTNDDLTSYLPADTETRQGLTIMEDNFTTYATARIMVSNISLDRAETLSHTLKTAKGVTSVDFYDPDSQDSQLSDYYKDASALFTITFAGETEDEICSKAMNTLKEMLSGYDYYIDSEIGNSINDTLGKEMQIVMAIAVVIIVVVLLFTSKTYMEVPVLLITFGAAALLNMGTNFLMGEISFVTNSIAVVLQLALAIDYAIILCHRFTEEREFRDTREACIIALSKSIPEIAGSSLTTISGLVAMMFMQFRIGYDMGIVLVKAIILSLLSVFTLMPGLLMLFAKGMDKTHHKNFVPKIDAVGHFAVKTKVIIPLLFAGLLVGAFILSNNCPYVYGSSTLTTFKKNEAQIAKEKVTDTFGSTNTLAMVVPSGDYAKEKALLSELKKMEHIDSVTGLSSVEIKDGYVLTDQLTPRQMSELMDIDYSVIKLAYTAYAADQGSYGQIIGGIDDYSVPLIDMFMFIYDQKEAGYISLSSDLNQTLDSLHDQLVDAKAQLSSDDYTRFVLQLDLPEESDETFAYLKTLHNVAARYYSEVYLVGNSTSDYDLSQSFIKDNLMTNILSVLFVLIVLVFTFMSAGLPFLLIVVIEGSIWVNFSFPYLLHQDLFFMSYLIVSSIQMGANIDYAIVISSRYTELRQTMDSKHAIIEALNQSFPTIITSGTILAAAGILISMLSSVGIVASIGECLGRGTIISIILVLFVLPQILVLGDIIIEKTSFVLKKAGVINHTATSGNLAVKGHVRGYVNGIVDADIRGVIQGSVSALVDTGVIENQDETAGTRQIKEESEGKPDET